MEQFVRKYQKNLRCGITTGSCATAAADAAASRLLLGITKEKVNVITPKGIKLNVEVFFDEKYAKNNEHDNSEVSFYVVKDSGDDPDVTNQSKIYVSVKRLPDDYQPSTEVFTDEKYPNIYLTGGEGVGRVTKAGLEQKIGQPAINVVPRNMIFDAVGRVCEIAECRDNILVTVSIPGGEIIAKRTFNPRLGIEGGLSVLGTSGIIEPMSEKSIIDTIETEIKQKSALGMKIILVTPGNYGQGYVKDYFQMDLADSIKCSNYIGDTIDLAVSYGMEGFILIGNIGKLVKLAAGIMNTHSRVADGRCEVLATHAALTGGSKALIERIMKSVTTEEILDILEEEKLMTPVMESIMAKIDEVMTNRTGGRIRYAVYVFSEKKGFLGCTAKADEVLSEYK